LDWLFGRTLVFAGEKQNLIIAKEPFMSISAPNIAGGPSAMASG